MVNVLPNIFKAIALFTPGGDLIYGIDTNKQAQWHSDLCLGLQKKWGLDDSPHFLVPGYSATVERWFNPQTQQIETIAEVYPPTERYIPLLQVLFNLEINTTWHIAPWQEEHCNRAIIETYKTHFPQLWEQRDLIIRLDRTVVNSDRVSQTAELIESDNNHSSSYVLRLFISGDRPSAEQILSSIHQLLEQGLDSPYTLKVIDIDKHPQQAAIHQITVTPTLVRVLPKPVRRIVGKLDDIQRILNIISSF
ncbi:circadian clock KaiB family protein [Waterburya agarophytonicola K14]|uniref:Circadian clock KaiB family protein n=1 Tax=Waterburya agarophytonicola KI4 TaxID=2874699 RepID=A0A964BQ32_9CYAN|nr:circadian clock KaiB family protein [Waterburya agarophytonicola]MCC0177315.1 circadian clock KaiB family protein [Waterburya agarophytonicola KI4]